MAVRRIKDAAPRYLGESTDAKPADAPDGSRFVESNTGREFERRGGEWRQVGTAAWAAAESPVELLLGLILVEARRVRNGIEQLLGTQLEDPGE